MATYVNPNSGNYEVWDNPPEGYLTPEEYEKLHPTPPPPPPTKEEQLAALDGDYMAQKNELIEQYTDSQIHGDADTMAAIVEEMNDLDAWYDTEYERIINEEGE